MKKICMSVLAVAALTASPMLTNANTEQASLSMQNSVENSPLSISLSGRYESGAAFAAGGAEIVAYDKESQQMYSINGDAGSIDILDGKALTKNNRFTDIPLQKQLFPHELDATLPEISGLTSIAVHPSKDIIAVATVAEPKTDPGHILFLTKSGVHLATVEVGALPDMVTFTPDGNKLLVANEGEPNDDYSINPEGSVSVIDVSNGVEKLAAITVPFDENIIEDDVRKVHPDASYAEDLEPEYITVNSDSSQAYIALQENNAIATLNLDSHTFSSVKSLGYKDHSVKGNGLDASDKDGKINIQNYPVLGLYQPDAIALYETEGKTYIVTPNEGDAQDYEGFSEEVRAADLQDQVAFNAALFDGYSEKELAQLTQDDLFADENLGRLNVTTAAPTNKDGQYEALYSYGARSFSIFDADTMELVFDSGDEFEQKIAELNPEYFNTDNEEDAFDDRSDNKGPEPETVVLGEVAGKTYAFIALERDGGLFVYDITKPSEARYEAYFSTRIFGENASDGDNAPEGLSFIPASSSPTNQTTLLASYEVSGTVAAFTLEGEQTLGKDAAEAVVHTVQPGETLFEIGLHYNYLWTTLAENNQLKNSQLIYPGDEIVIK